MRFSSKTAPFSSLSLVQEFPRQGVSPKTAYESRENSCGPLFLEGCSSQLECFSASIMFWNAEWAWTVIFVTVLFP
jgi:hypothetical protein